jgi:nucleoside-diphosphate-sugar epimerase
MLMKFVTAVGACLALCSAVVAAADGVDTNVYLEEATSVVLITGAAGFLGSELAMALHLTYAPKKLICVDGMDQGFGSGTKSEADLALFEFKRQRVFHMLQTVKADSIFFYRVDLRPSIPEYFDTSEVPVLHHIFEEHPDITHVVHLADHVHHSQQQHESLQQPVIPRIKGQEKAGLMEALLEELLLQKVEKGKALQFVYASSAAVYNHFAQNHDDSPNPPPFAEGKPLTTPSTAAGASKLVDELLAQAYHDVHGIPSTALRFFDVYGPWGLPGSALFDMAERAVAGHDPATPSTKTTGDAAAEDNNKDNRLLDNLADYTYIDDAIDALMAAMQFGTTQAVAINVGTGKATSLRTIADMMRELVHSTDEKTTVDHTSSASEAKTISYSDNTRASALLGFEPQVSVRQGIEKLLAWHYDRAYPYGSGAALDGDGGGPSFANKGIAACSRYDTECLKGTPVFPCASECSHATQCKRSLYDDVLELTRAITAKCTTVLYTVSLGNDVTRIPSTHVRVSTQSVAYVDDKAGSHCNLAFVAEASPLYRNAARENQAADGIVMNGFWSLIPVALTPYAEDKKQLLSLLPKLSPGNFFADTVEKAIYCDPDVIIDSIPRLLQESNMQPKHPSVQGATVMLIGKKPVDVTAQQRPLRATTEPTPPNELVQDTAYRMIRMAVIDEMAGDGFAQKIDSGFVVHTLRGNNMEDEDDDGRLFRCDVFGEVVQWQVESDLAAIEFILGLHDMWSRVMVKKSGLNPWWIGDDVATVSRTTASRRLNEVSQKEDEEKNEAVSSEVDADADHVEDRQLTEEEDSHDEDDEINHDETKEKGLDAPDAAEGEHNGFGVVGAIEAVFGYGKQQQQRFDRPEDEEADDFVVDDDDAAELNPLGGADGADAANDGHRYYLPNADQDPSSYDVWMGVLSSTPVRYFSRIVSMEAVGVYCATEDYDGVSSM